METILVSSSVFMVDLICMYFKTLSAYVHAEGYPNAMSH